MEHSTLPFVIQLHPGHPDFRDPLAGEFTFAYVSLLLSRFYILGDRNALLMMRDQVDVAEQRRIVQGYYGRDMTIAKARKNGILMEKPNRARYRRPGGFV